MYPMGREVDAKSESVFSQEVVDASMSLADCVQRDSKILLNSRCTTRKEEQQAKLQQHVYPKLAALEKQVKLYDIDQNHQITLECFQSALRSLKEITLREEEITEIFHAIDTHNLGFIYFEDVTDLLDMSDLSPILRRFLRLLDVEPKGAGAPPVD